MKIGIVGLGFVGNAVRAYFTDLGVEVLGYDGPKGVGSMEAASQADVVFIAVPTPSKPSGECDVSIVEEVLGALSVLNSAYPRLVVLKSTVPVGYCPGAAARFQGIRLVFAPEFLTEASAVLDFATCNRLVLGGDDIDVEAVSLVFRKSDPARWDEGRVVELRVSWMEAELIKLMGNAFLMTKVLFANEIRNLCVQMGVAYDTVRAGVALDPRIGASHLLVPGPDGQFGAGGHCFPKDMANLLTLFKEHGVPERVLSAVNQRNLEVR